MLKADTLKEIDKLADELGARFESPQYIPGCVIKSVADKDQYATDNGWVEAIVGQHNQQRCRWRGQFANVAVDSVVDVVYYPSYKIFMVAGQGGASAYQGATPAAHTHYQLWESDGGAAAWSTDADGNLSGAKAVQGYFDHVLSDTANASGLASHFRDNTATYPTGWTEADAAAAIATNTRYSYWQLNGSSSNTTWKYRRQTALNIESTVANSYINFQIGPVLWRNGKYTADCDYVFGMYRDNSGAIDETVYSRTRLHWDYATSVWQVRGEASDGSTATNGSYISLAAIPIQPMFFRFYVRNDATKNTRQYAGYHHFPNAQTFLQGVAATVTWGQVWLQFEMSRGAGTNDIIYIGAADYILNAS